MKKRNQKMVSIFVVAFLLLQNIVPLLALNIPMGTIIQLEAVNTISSENAYAGQKVRFRVLDDVIIGGKLAVMAGAKATGTIISLDEPGMIGKPGNLSIQLTRVEAVDGTNIPISAYSVLKGKNNTGTAIAVTLILCIFGLFIQGGDAVMQAGSVIEAEVINNVGIDANNVVNKVVEEKAPVVNLEQGTYLEITTRDGKLITGKLESKENSNVSLLSTKVLYKIALKYVSSAVDRNGNNVTNKLSEIEDFKSTTKYNWNKITLEEIH